MTAPTFTCDRCGKPLAEPGALLFSPPLGHTPRLVGKIHLCRVCYDAVRRDIDQFAGEGADTESASDAAPSPVPDESVRWTSDKSYEVGNDPVPDTVTIELADRLESAASRSLSGGGEWVQLAHRALEAVDVLRSPAESSDAGDGHPHVGDDTGDDPTGDAAPESFRTGGDTQPAAPSLVERLRDPDECRYCNRAEAMRLAADRIEELEADMATMHRSVVHECCEKVQELEAQRERIRGTVRSTVFTDNAEFDRSALLVRVWQAMADPLTDAEKEWLSEMTDRPVDLASDDRPVDFTVKGDSVKMLRETFCVAQLHLMRNGCTDDAKRIQRLIDICDTHRPLGPNGKHGTRRCTPTCGCEDKSYDPVDLASDDRPVDFTVKGDSVKMLRETFCVAQTSILRDREVDPDWFRQIHLSHRNHGGKRNE